MSENPQSDGTPTSIHLTAEQAQLADEIQRIDAELDDNEERSRRVAIAGIRSGGSIPASGGVLRGRSNLDDEHDTLISKRERFAQRLKQSVEDSEVQPD